MKNKLVKILIGLALVASVTSSIAQVPLKGFCGQGTRITNSYDCASVFVASANSSPLTGPAVATYINATASNTTSQLVFFLCGPGYSVGQTNGLASLTNIYVTPDITLTNQVWPASNTNGMFVTEPVLIRHVSTDTYERNRIYSWSQTNLTFEYALINPTLNGDLIYQLTTNGTVNIGAASAVNTTLTIGPTGDGFCNAQYPGRPLVIELDANNNAQSINAVSGKYLP